MNSWAVLGISINASEEEIRSAYLAKVKEHPPDRSPEEFERIRDAYETLRDPRREGYREAIYGADEEADDVEIEEPTGTTGAASARA